MAHVDQETKVAQEVSPNDGTFDFSNDKHPTECAAQSQSSVRDRFPYVLIDVLLTACNLSGSGCLGRSVREGVMTLTSAPVSIRYCMPLFLSVT